MVKQEKEKFDPRWDEVSTFDEWVEKMIRSGKAGQDEVTAMMLALPKQDKLRLRVREIWKRVMAERKYDEG